MLEAKNVDIPLTKSPNVEQVNGILCKTDIIIPGKYKATLAESLKKLELMEANYTEYLQEKALEKWEEDLISSIENSDFFEDSREVVNRIKLSAGYTAEIICDENNKFSSGKIEIRTTAKQYRHVTPVAVVEKIILDTLKEGATADDILKALSHKIEFFKRNYTLEDNDFIQRIFSYFSSSKYKNFNGIMILIKILAYLYNEDKKLAMRDSYIEIPYRTNDRFFVPLLLKNSKEYLHQGEGSFTRELRKIISSFEKAAKENELTELQIKRMVYAIFAMFDYFPLPKNSKNKNKKYDSTRDRYV